MCLFRGQALRTFSHLFIFYPVLALILTFESPASGKETSQEEMIDTLMTMSLEELVKMEVSIATRSPIPVRKAPAIAKVISAEEIRMMGARSLVDVLERVVGVGVNRVHYSVYSLEIRGLKAIRQNKVNIYRRSR